MGRTPALDRALTEVGRRLCRERHASGLRQEDVAGRVGCDRAYVSYVEHGRRNLTVGTLLAMADAIGVDAAVLVAGLHVIKGSW